jgi:hypothetical protein
MSAAQNNKLESLAGGSWLDKQSLLFASIAAGVSVVRPVSMSQPGDLVTGITDGHINGGGVAIQTNGLWVSRSLAYLIQDSRAVPWAYAFRVKLPVPATGKYAMLGIGNSATQYACIATYYDLSTPARTKVVFIGSDGSVSCELDSNLVIDGTSWHDVAVGWDTVNLSLSIDGAVVQLAAASVKIPHSSVAGIYVRASDAGATVYCTDACYAV